MKANRKKNITISIIGIAMTLGLLIYYITHNHLWKKEIHIGFAAVFALLGWRLWKGMKHQE